MNRKFAVITSLILVLMIMLSVSAVLAYESEKKKGRGHGYKDKFAHKAYLILKNQDELGLSDDQVDKVKDLMIKTEKDLIMKKAEIETLGLDIKAKMWEDTIDTDAVNALIDQKYELKKAKAKYLVGARAALKNLLTADQSKTLKSLCYKKKKEREKQRVV